MKQRKTIHNTGIYGACKAMFLFAAIAFCGALAATANTQPCQLTVRAERENAIYTVGEPVTFLVDLKHADGHSSQNLPKLEWTITKDGHGKIDSGYLELKDGKAQLTAKLDQPGFLRCVVKFPANFGDCKNGKLQYAFGGAAIEPEKIKASLPSPDDFDSFWNAQKAALRVAKPEVTLTPVKNQWTKNDTVKIFDLQASAPEGVHVSGYLGYPASAKPKSLPAMLFLHGAGVRSSNIGPVSNWAAEGALVLDINAHGIPNGQPKEFYDNLSNGELKGYSARVPQSRETSYFRTMFLRVICAIDILTAMPEWDGTTLIVYGTSQGGAQALAAAGLDERVTFAVAGVSAMCDQTGMVANQATGWPRSVPVDAQGNPDAKTLEVVRYYDMINFASRIKAPVAMTVGFIDVTCPPTTVYAAYNNITGEKTMFNDITAGHTNTPSAVAFMNGKMREHIKSQAAKKAK